MIPQKKIAESKKNILILIRDIDRSLECDIKTQQMVHDKVNDLLEILESYELNNFTLDAQRLPRLNGDEDDMQEKIEWPDAYQDFHSPTKLENKFVLQDKIDSIYELLEEISNRKEISSYKTSEMIKESISALATNTFYEEIMSAFDKEVEVYESISEDGSLIQGLGNACDGLLKQGIEAYEKKALLYWDTKSYDTKLEILESEMISKLEDLYYRQVQTLKELCFQSFRDSLAAIQVNSNVDSEVKGAVKVTEKYFKTKKAVLKPKDKKFEINDSKETHELLSGIREMATERLQTARLQGVYLQKNKHPLSLSFHLLHPHPFGKDSRFDSININDTMNYNPDLSKRAGLMRQFASNNSGIKSPMENSGTNRNDEVDMIYREEPLQSFQNNS
jgi:hypothetical protein